MAERAVTSGEQQVPETAFDVEAALAGIKIDDEKANQEYVTDELDLLANGLRRLAGFAGFDKDNPAGDFWVVTKGHSIIGARLYAERFLDQL